MSKFLTDKEIGAAIIDLVKDSKNVRCAVAFWGDGAKKKLFPEVVPSDAQIVCDLVMGGSNPAELKALGAPKREIRHLPNLHAKVYISDKGLITGSANASNNGIGFGEAAGLIEAGTFHEPNSEAYKAAVRWFSTIWEDGSPVDKATLEKAEKAWASRKSRRGVPFLKARPKDNPASLFDAVLRDPERFRGVGFVFTTEDSVTKEDLNRAEADVLEDKSLSTKEKKELKKCNEKDTFMGWTPIDISAWPSRFICAHREPKKPFSYYFYEVVQKTEKSTGVVFSKRSDALQKDLGFECPVKEMNKADLERGKLIFDHIKNDKKCDGHKLFDNGEALARALDELVNLTSHA
jgi:hypothetical protein